MCLSLAGLDVADQFTVSGAWGHQSDQTRDAGNDEDELALINTRLGTPQALIPRRL